MTGQEFDETYKILVAAAEATPFAKTGGLADVAGSLPKALSAWGNDVRLVIPCYRGIDDWKVLADFPVWVNGRRETAVLRQSYVRARVDDVDRLIPVYFIDSYHYFDRDRFYDFPDDAERWAFFSRAILEMIRVIGWKPDIIHGHDWQTGPLPLLLKTHYVHDPFYSLIATVFTVHNLKYQGNFDREALSFLGLGDDYFVPDRVEFYGQVSYLKAGLVFSDLISTVSRRYAREIQGPGRGYGFEGVLAQRSQELFGIPHGVNYHEFNPATDPRLHHNYSVNNALQGKRLNKHALQKELGLPIADLPLIGMVTRFEDNKGIELLQAASDEILRLDVQMVLLGVGERRYEGWARELAWRYPQRVATQIGFNTVLAQRVYAGADIVLFPTRQEPDGMGQLIAMRYGAIPVAHATGGLADTIMDYQQETGGGTGFLFEPYEPSMLVQAIGRALDVYNNAERWRPLVEAAMRQDFSWNRVAGEYMGLYRLAREKVHQRELVMV